MRKRYIVALASAVALGLSGGAAAQDNHVSPPLDGGGPGGQVAGEVGEQAAGEGALPFTGFQAGLVFLGGAGIALTGLALRRAGRKPQS